MAKLNFKNGFTSVVLRVKIMDSTSTTGGSKTGLTFSSSGLIISTIADNEATATAYTQAGSTIETITTLGTFAAPTATKCRFKEVDNTNHPGLYEIQIADARWAVSNARSVIVSVLGATGAAQVDAEIQLEPVPANVRQLLDTASQGAAGYAAVDMAQALPANPAANSLGEALYLADILGGRFGTAQAGGASTITLDAGASSTDGRYVGYGVYLYGGTGGGFRGTGQERTIVAYNGTTKVATVAQAWGTNPDNTSKFMLTVQPFANVGIINGTTIAGTGTRIADAFVTAFNVASPVFTTASVNQTGDAYAVVNDGTFGNSKLVRSTTPANTLDVSATGEAGVDWANVGGKTTTNALTNTTIATTQKVDIETIKTNPVVNAGTVTFPTTATLASTTNITAGTITTVTTVTNQLTAAAIATGVWTDTTAGDFTVALSVGKSVMNGVSLGTGLTVATATNVTTVNGLAANVITAASIASDADTEIAGAVWDLATSGHTTSGTFGAAMNAAGSAGDPWGTSLPGAYGAGTAGYIVGNNPDTAGTTTLLTRTPNAVAGAAGGLLIAGSNAPTTFAGSTSTAGLTITGGTTATGALTITGGSTSGGGILVTTTAGHGVSTTGGGTGFGFRAVGGISAGASGALFAAGAGSGGAGIVTNGNGAGDGITSTGGSTGTGIHLVGGATSGDGLLVATTSGNGLSITATGTSKHGILVTGGTGGTSDGIKAVAGTGGVPIRGDITGNITGTLSTVTTLTNLPAITTDWITAAGVSAAAVTKIQAGLSTYAGGDTSGTTTLLTRVTAAVALAGVAPSWYTAPVDVSANVAAIKAKTDNLPALPASTTNITAGTITTVTTLTNLPAITTDWITAAGVSAAAANKIADHGRRRTQANVEASADGDALNMHSEYGAIQMAQKQIIVGAVGTIYKTDGTTPLGTVTYTSDPAAEPITGAS